MSEHSFGGLEHALEPGGADGAFGFLAEQALAEKNSAGRQFELALPVEVMSFQESCRQIGPDHATAAGARA